MSRRITQRWELTGSLVAQSPIHVRGLAGGQPNLTQARDGLGRPVLPGTSLAGVIRAALGPLDAKESELWGRASEPDDTGHDDGTGVAARVRVDDAPAPLSSVVESREHVSIDRTHGVAARGHLFTREMLPIGTRFAFRMVIDDDDGVSAGALARRVTALLRGPGIMAGTGTSKGLGQLRLDRAELHRFDLATRAGVIAALRGNGSQQELPEANPDALGGHLLRVSIPWRPRGPLMVQVSADGDVVDSFPLTTTANGRVRLELPGESIKGVLRSHAERIMRTLFEIPAPKTFLDQMAADGLGPVAALFGTAAARDSTGGPSGRRGALRVNTCLSRVELPAAPWRAVRLLQQRDDSGRPVAAAGAHNGSDADDHRAALGRLQQAVDELNRQTEGIAFRVAHHVAVDRWTGGAAESLLFATLEPHITSPDAWPPIMLELDMARLTGATESIMDSEQQRAVVLLLLLLRDLCDGWIGFGHGTTRGMGAVHVESETIRFATGSQTGWREHLHRRCLAEILRDEKLIGQLTESWPPQDHSGGSE